MSSSMCFMSVVALLVTDMRIGALEENGIQPNQCYNCHANNTTSCEQSSSWISITCPVRQPYCATIASAPNFRSSLVCAAATEKKETCIVNTNSSFVMTCVCRSHLCNAPFIPEWRQELLSLLNNNTDVKQENIYESLFKFTNVSTADNLYKAITTEVTETVTTVGRISSKSYTLLPNSVTMNIQAISTDLDKPRAESLKQEPTVPSDDDEDESEGSGSYEEAKIHNHPVSAPAAPSSFLPAKENSANLLYKDLIIFTLYVYFVV